MRAAEALILGSTIVKPVAGNIDDDKGGGCALGMINHGLGSNQRYEFTETFPWMWKENYTALPCDCKDERLIGSGCGMFPRNQIQRHITSIVVHLFNWHVCHVHDWTIDRLAEYIDSVDPTPRETPKVEEPSVEPVHA